MKKELSILIGLVAVWCLGIIVAPLFANSRLSELLYSFYSAVCHQFDSHSFHIDNNKFAVCIRCFSIYVGFLFVLVLLQFPFKLEKFYAQTMIITLIFSVPMIFDGVLSLIGLTTSTTITRVLTGSLFGIGIGFLLHQSLTEILHDLIQFKRKKHEIKTR